MIKLICVGRIKERFFADAADYYKSGLTGGAPAAIVEVPDESAPEGLSEAGKRKITEKEGKALLKQISAATVVVALDINGNKYEKAQINAIIRDAADRGRDVAFVIGGSLGLGQNVLERADYRWSLSSMTLPHQMARAVVLGALAE